ncbi:MAG: hypothetical protein Q9226_006725 [Calogaya cf. arnoldii]
MFFGNASTINSTTTWVPEPNVRGTWSLLSTCIITVSLCVWSAVHLNVREHQQVGPQYWRKAKWLLLGIFAPEFLAYIAWQQRQEASKLSRAFRATYQQQEPRGYFEKIMQSVRSLCRTQEAFAKDPESVPASTESTTPLWDPTLTFEPPPSRPTQWKLVHGFYALMGGFTMAVGPEEDPSFPYPKELQSFLPDHVSRVTLTSDGLRFLMYWHPKEVPSITAEQIWDKSKADGLKKTLVCVQAIWFCIQCITRLAQSLPVSLLELNTFGHALCTLAIYIFWWDKPLDIEEPTTINNRKLFPLIAYMWMTSRISAQSHCDHDMPDGLQDEFHCFWPFKEPKISDLDVCGNIGLANYFTHGRIAVDAVSRKEEKEKLNRMLHILSRMRGEEHSTEAERDNIEVKELNKSWKEEKAELAEMLDILSMIRVEEPSIEGGEDNDEAEEDNESRQKEKEKRADMLLVLSRIRVLELSIEAEEHREAEEDNIEAGEDYHRQRFHPGDHWSELWTNIQDRLSADEDNIHSTTDRQPYGSPLHRVKYSLWSFLWPKKSVYGRPAGLGIRNTAVSHVSPSDVNRWSHALYAIFNYNLISDLHHRHRIATSGRFFGRTLGIRIPFLDSIQDNGLNPRLEIRARNAAPLLTPSGILPGFALAGALYGGLHLVAWSAPLSSPLEELLWRIAGVSVTFTGITIGLLALIAKTDFCKQSLSNFVKVVTRKPLEASTRGEKVRKHFAAIGMGILFCVILPCLPLLWFLYLASRGYLVVESLKNIAYLPPGSFEQPEWPSYFPHIS